MSAEATGEQILLLGWWLVVCQNQSQVFNNRNCASRQFALCVSLADDQLGSHCTSTVVDIDSLEGDGFIDTAGSKQADAKQGAVAVVLKSFAKEQLYVFLSENLCSAVAVYLHGHSPFIPLMKPQWGSVCPVGEKDQTLS
jgi:hypothetical protein